MKFKVNQKLDAGHFRKRGTSREISGYNADSGRRLSKESRRVLQSRGLTSSSIAEDENGLNVDTEHVIPATLDVLEHDDEIQRNKKKVSKGGRAAR